VAVPFLSLTLGDDRHDVEQAIRRVLDRGWFILGPELEAFEHEFARISGAARAVGVASGTDALMLVLRALDIGPGDEVIAPALTAAYTALAIRMAGATPVFADVDPVRATMDPAAAAALVTPRTRALMPVHLYGQPADMKSLMALAGRHGLAVIEDCAQAHMGTCNGRPVGTIGAAGAFSFYPTKNLGALGDAGAVITNDPALADRIARLRNGGQAGRNRHVEAGVNSRLDELQAAILQARLPRLVGWTAARRQLAVRYRETLRGANVFVPPELDSGHVYHLFTIRCPERDRLQRGLDARGIGTLVHYPIPVPRQPAFADLPAGAWAHADRTCQEVLSLPLSHALTPREVEEVAHAVHAAAHEMVSPPIA